MKKKIIFIGGIHGVGKGTFCQKIFDSYQVEWFSASDLLRWSEISTKENKRVADFDETQQRLLQGIKNRVPNNKLSLLDGHFCLLNNDGIPEVINEEVFYQIRPMAIGIISSNLNIVKGRLESRDRKTYNLDTLSNMQKMEIEHSKKISLHLDIPFFEISDGDGFVNFEEYLKQQL